MSERITEQPRKAVIRTSDRQLFKRCRRKWGWQSPVRQNLTTTASPSYFWIGTGGHYSLEDYHGYNIHQHPVEAFLAYVKACKKCQRIHKYGLPTDWEEQTELAVGILEYYLIWQENREFYPTVWLDGVPQVETRCQIPLTQYIDPDLLERSHFDEVVYQFTLDRLVEIEGEYWIQDWKFYKAFGQGDLDFDQQMGAYIWAASSVFDKPIAGAILHEFRKELANPPRIVAGGKLSTAENQKTTHRMYRDTVVRMYGEVNKAPQGVIKRLNAMAEKETPDGDSFIRRGKTRRTEQQQRAEGTKILMEIEDMINPDLPLYTNATRDCSWDCQLRDVCIEIDRDEGWEGTLTDITRQRTEEQDTWRQYLKVA